MAFNIVQVQGGVALADANGNVLGVFDDDGVLRLQVEAKISADSPKVLDTAVLLEGIQNELRRIRVLLEHMSDERVEEDAIETKS